MSPLRAVAAVGTLRRRCVYQAIREATLTTARRESFRIVHLSIQHNHVHLLVEAADKHALASGIQAERRLDSGSTPRWRTSGRLQFAVRRRTMRGG